MKTYVYAHVEPRTEEIVYIGMGTWERAWSRPHNRNHEHRQFIEELHAKGVTADQWVRIMHRGLEREQARAVERDLIKTIKPKYNQMMLTAANAGRGTANKLSKLNDEIVTRMRAMYAEGNMSMRAVGRKFQISASSARKILKGLAWTHIPNPERGIA